MLTNLSLWFRVFVIPCWLWWFQAQIKLVQHWQTKINSVTYISSDCLTWKVLAQVFSIIKQRLKKQLQMRTLPPRGHYAGCWFTFEPCSLLLQHAAFFRMWCWRSVLLFLSTATYQEQHAGVNWMSMPWSVPQWCSKAKLSNVDG